MQTNIASRYEGKSFRSIFIRISWIILLIASVAQLMVSGTLANLYAVAVVLVGWKLTVELVLNEKIIEGYPLSCYVLLGFSLCQFYIPLVGTLTEGHPLVFNMEVPFDVFTHSLLGLIVLILAHICYRFMLNRQPYFYIKIQKFLYRQKIYDSPSDAQLWIMGLGGLMAMFYVYFYSPSVGNEISGTGDKFIQGIIPFTYAPFYFLVKKLYGSQRKTSKKDLVRLALFTVLLFLVSMGRNSRGAFMFGFTALGFGYFLSLLLKMYSPALLTRKNIIIAIVALAIMTGPMADLVIAMAIVRKYRKDIDRVELLKLTFDTYQNKALLKEFKEEVSGPTEIVGAWDEHYFDNVFLARFSNLKYNDASLDMANKLGGIDPVVADYAIKRPMALLPEPLIKLFHVNVDKSTVNSFSSGDLLFDRTGATNALGGFRVGHFAGFGMASFGWWYLLFLFVLVIPVYFLWDTLVLRTSNPNFRWVFSFVGLMYLTIIFQFITFENVLYMVQFLVRGWVQMIFMYYVIFRVTKFMETTFIKR